MHKHISKGVSICQMSPGCPCPPWVRPAMPSHHVEEQREHVAPGTGTGTGPAEKKATDPTHTHTPPTHTHMPPPPQTHIHTPHTHTDTSSVFSIFHSCLWSSFVTCFWHDNIMR